jgi:peptide/nickel transport system ATP-binding protein
MPYDQGRILFDGEAVGSATCRCSDLRRRVQMVFQDSYASLNPRLTVEDTVAFGPRVHGLAADAARERAHELLRKVGLDPAVFAGRYPHELSGGQKQRVNIARALALSPRLVILDEAVSALDKSVEAQVINLLIDLKNEFGLTYIFISHDLNVIRFISDRIVVMYLGEVAEIGPARRDLRDPRSTPTPRALTRLHADHGSRTSAPMEAPLSGDPPNPIDPAVRFAASTPRCCPRRGAVLAATSRRLTAAWRLASASPACVPNRVPAIRWRRHRPSRREDETMLTAPPLDRHPGPGGHLHRRPAGR